MLHLKLVAGLCFLLQQTYGQDIGQGQGSAKAMLDSMELMMSGQAEFDPVYFDQIERCLGSVGSDLVAAHDLSWYGMVQYFDANGAPGDEWGSQGSSYVENNVTIQSYHNMTIYEPCNYASNVAYYRVATSICARTEAIDDPWALASEIRDALVEIFMELPMMSGFMHASHTELGHTFDIDNIRIFAWLIHQSMISNYNCSDVTVVKDLQHEPRNRSALELTYALREIYLTKPVHEWKEMIDQFDMPDEYLSFGGIVVNIVTVLFEDEFADTILITLKELFGLPQDMFDFLYTELVPQFRQSTVSLQLGPLQKLHLEENAISTIIKLLYAFLWQEEIFFFDGHENMVFNETINAWGADHIDDVNAFANALNTFNIYDESLQTGVDAYPGAAWCNPSVPHAKWHTQAAAGLLDLVFLADNVVSLTKDLAF